METGFASPPWHQLYAGIIGVVSATRDGLVAVDRATGVGGGCANHRGTATDCLPFVPLTSECPSLTIELWASGSAEPQAHNDLARVLSEAFQEITGSEPVRLN